jgi:Zn-dependent metalloprotease
MTMLTGMVVMTYGDGSDTYFDALTSIVDVNNVCEKTANLAYQKNLAR